MSSPFTSHADPLAGGIRVEAHCQGCGKELDKSGIAACSPFLPAYGPTPSLELRCPGCDSASLSRGPVGSSARPLSWFMGQMAVALGFSEAELVEAYRTTPQLPDPDESKKKRFC